MSNSGSDGQGGRRGLLTARGRPWLVRPSPRRPQAQGNPLEAELGEALATQRSLRKELRAALEAADAAQRSKTSYVMGLSHELRSPLNAILGYAQLLERRPDNPRVQENAGRTIRRSGEHLASMIEGLLDISKIEAGHMRIDRHKMALRPFFDDLVDMFALQAKAKGIDFSFSAETVFPDAVYSDEKRLRQILINLLSNAIKFTEEGSVRFVVRYRAEVASFTIADTGTGIAPDDQARIFEPFERAGETGSGETNPGTGLGLTITKLLAELMGGVVELTSTPGVGSTFTVRLLLPSAAHADDSERPKRTITGYEGRRFRVLVTDNTETHRALITDLLEPLGFEIAEAESGEDALAQLQARRADLVLLDIAMPGLSGWETAAQIRTQFGKSLPIVMVSANAGADRHAPERQPLYDGYLIKPFALNALLDQIENLLPIVWTHAGGDADGERVEILFSGAELPPQDRLGQLYSLIQADLVRSADALLADIERESPHAARFCKALRDHVRDNRMTDAMAVIEKARAHGG